MNRLILGLFLFSSLIVNNSSSQTISGSITSDTTWSGTVIADSVNIPVGRILTIQPGTKVKFNTGKMLVVAGKIIANGKSDSTISFTSNSASPAAGNWNGIELQNTSSASSIINYCVIEYAGGGANAANIFYKTGAPNINISNSIIQKSSNNGINPRSSSPRISNTQIRQNAGYGIFADLSLSYTIDSCAVSNNTVGGVLIGVNATAIIQNSAIDSNGTGIFISNSAAPTIKKNNIRRNNVGIQFAGVGATQPIITQDTILNNITWGFLNTSTSSIVSAQKNYWGSDAGPFNLSTNPTGLGDKVSNNVDFQPWILLASPKTYVAVTGNITKDSTWPSGIFWIKNSISVNTPFKLTIKPGVIVKFATGARLTVNGSINANGTPDSLIIFTSIKDDSYGGRTDTNNTFPAVRGDWDMVWLSNGQNSSSVLNNCIFKWGGSSSNGMVRIDGVTPTISNIFCTQSANYGMWLLNGANSTISNSTFGSNGSYGLYVYYSNPYIYRATIANNGSYGIYATGNSRFNVRKSKITGNTYGIVSDGGTLSSTLISMDSSDVSFNSSAGLYLWYGTGPQTFTYNRIEGNGGGYGLWCFNVNSLVTIDSNIILNNGSEGIVTSKASITNNLIQGNSYPIT
jgi:parallel beta-helix repeat protein